MMIVLRLKEGEVCTHPISEIQSILQKLMGKIRILTKTFSCRFQMLLLEDKTQEEVAPRKTEERKL